LDANPARSEQSEPEYTLHTGKRVYVRSVLLRGLETTKPSVADNRISLKPGDPLSQQSIAASQQKLYDLGIFSKVQTAIQNPGGDEGQKYVCSRWTKPAVILYAGLRRADRPHRGASPR